MRLRVALTFLRSPTELDDAAARVHKLCKALQAKDFFLQYPETDHRLVQAREKGDIEFLAPEDEAMVARIRALVNDADLLR